MRFLITAPLYIGIASFFNLLNVHVLFPSLNNTMSRPSTSYQILVIGAGLGGLAAATRLAYKGHKVRVLEGKPTLSEVGAGVQVPPNATRILSAWGLASDFEKVITDTKTTEFRRYESGEVLGVTHTNSLSVYGSSYDFVNSSLQ